MLYIISNEIKNLNMNLKIRLKSKLSNLLILK